MDSDSLIADFQGFRNQNSWAFSVGAVRRGPLFLKGNMYSKNISILEVYISSKYSFTYSYTLFNTNIVYVYLLNINIY